MELQADNPSDLSRVPDMLQPLVGAELTPTELATLVGNIRPYLNRTRLPLEHAVPRIAGHFLRDGARVRELLAARESPAWQDILMHVVAFARSSSLFPEPWEVTSWPDLDAYEDIRERLPEYNFEGSLDAWMAVVITSRLRRYWRDRNALSAGGGGFLTSDERDAARIAGVPVAGVRHLSLDLPAQDSELTLAEWLPMTTQTVAETVEGDELCRIVAAEVDAFAAQDDPLLADVWHAVFDQHLRLREAAESYGLTVSQTHRRVERMRNHLRRSPQVRRWFERGG